MAFVWSRRFLCLWSALVGIGAGSALRAADSEVVNLPAFVVDGADGKVRPVRWFYAELPGIRLLSCTSLESTENLVGALRDQTRLYRWMLPSEVPIETGGPLVAILDDRPATSLRLLLGSQQEQVRARGATRATVVGAAIVDWDFATLFRQPGRTAPTLAAASFVADACNAILTQQPGWIHLERVISRSRLNVTAVGNGVDIYQPPNSFAEKKLPLPSLAGLFATGTPAPQAGMVASQEELARWFGRWAMLADDGAHQPALWKFARATAAQPRLDDETSQYYFGLTIAAMDVYVSRFRQRSQATPGLHLRLPEGISTPLVEVREASEDDIACAVIQWCLSAGRQNPALQPSLQEAARRAVERARKAEQATPRVVAMAGLNELASGNVVDARVLLEDVAEDPRLNVRARFELARLRFEEASMQPAAMSRKLSARQTAFVMAPLAPFLSRPPASSEPLLLIARTWMQSEEAPSREDLRAIVAAARLFPRDDEFLLQVIELCGRNGLSDEAARLAAIGQAAAQNEDARAKFAELSKK